MRDINKLRYTKTHEWIDENGNAGITDHAQKEITDVVFVELPKAGQSVTSNKACAVIESVKAAFDIYAPVSGKITQLNEAVKNDPGMVNRSPFDDGWLFTMQIGDKTELNSLMTLNQYQEFLKNAVTH